MMLELPSPVPLVPTSLMQHLARLHPGICAIISNLTRKKLFYLLVVKNQN